jgi:hypothetical protein
MTRSIVDEARAGGIRQTAEVWFLGERVGFEKVTDHAFMIFFCLAVDCGGLYDGFLAWQGTLGTYNSAP